MLQTDSLTLDNTFEAVIFMKIVEKLVAQSKVLPHAIHGKCRVA